MEAHCRLERAAVETPSGRRGDRSTQARRILLTRYPALSSTTIPRTQPVCRRKPTKNTSRAWDRPAEELVYGEDLDDGGGRAGQQPVLGQLGLVATGAVADTGRDHHRCSLQSVRPGTRHFRCRRAAGEA